MNEKEYGKAREDGATVMWYGRSPNKRGRGKLTRRGLGNIWNAQLQRVPKRDGNFITRDEAHATYRENRERKNRDHKSSTQ